MLREYGSVPAKILNIININTFVGHPTIEMHEHTHMHLPPRYPERRANL